MMKETILLFLVLVMQTTSAQEYKTVNDAKGLQPGSEAPLFSAVDSQGNEFSLDESQRLPIPATYIINQERLVVWRQFDPNYKKRSTVSEILEALDKLDDK